MPRGGNLGQTAIDTMAGIFEWFGRASMAKRLLRYGLSKADIFEDEALNLDNLELTLGRKNVVEFRDVGLKLKVRGPWNLSMS